MRRSRSSTLHDLPVKRARGVGWQSSTRRGGAGESRAGLCERWQCTACGLVLRSLLGGSETVARFSCLVRGFGSIIVITRSACTRRTRRTLSGWHGAPLAVTNGFPGSPEPGACARVRMHGWTSCKKGTQRAAGVPKPIPPHFGRAGVETWPRTAGTDEWRGCPTPTSLSAEIELNAADISRSMHLRCRRLLRRYSVGPLLS